MASNAGARSGAKIDVGKTYKLPVNQHKVLQVDKPAAFLTISFLSPPKSDSDYPKYVLESHDQAYRVERSLRAHVVKDKGCHQIRFEKLLPGKNYKLTETAIPGHSRVLFEGLPYGDVVDQFRPEIKTELDNCRFVVPSLKGASSTGEGLSVTSALARSGVHKFRVHLKEITRLHDLALHRRKNPTTEQLSDGTAPGGLQEYWLVTTLLDSKSNRTVPAIQRWRYQLKQQNEFVTGRETEIYAYASDRIRTNNEAELFDGDSESKRIVIRDELVSLRTTVNYPDHGSVSRTFSPKDSELLKSPKKSSKDEERLEKWAYVFRADDENGTNGKLLLELCFDESGGFQRSESTPQDWEEYSKIRQDGQGECKPRPLAKTKEKELWLDVEIYETDQQTKSTKRRFPKYFFLVSSWQIPGDAILTIEKELALRAVRLGDYFHTRVLEDGKSGQASPLLPVPEALKAFAIVQGVPTDDPSEVMNRLLEAGKLAFELHLVDPFVEAERRADDLQEVLTLIESKLPKAPDSKCLLAKEMELFTQRDPRLRAIVQKKLYEYLYPEGKDAIERLWEMVDLYLDRIITWIGYYARRTGPEAYWETAFRLTRRREMDPLKDRRTIEMVKPSSAAPTLSTSLPVWNEYSHAIGYFTNAPEPTRAEVLDSEARVKGNLPILPDGQEYLFLDLRRVIAENKALAGSLDISDKNLERLRADSRKDKENHRTPHSSGMDLTLATKKGWTDNGESILQKVNAVYGLAWVRNLDGKDVLAKLDKMQRYYKVGPVITDRERDLLASWARSRSPGLLDERSAAVKKVEQELSKVNRDMESKAERLPLFPCSRLRYAGKAAGSALGFVSSGIGAYLAIMDVIENRDDPTLYLKALKHSTDALSSLAGTVSSVTIAARGVAAPKIVMSSVSTLGTVSASLNLLTSVVELSQARERAQYIAVGGKCLMAAVGLLSLSGSAAIAVAIIGLVVSEVLDCVGFELREFVKFLRHSEFGGSSTIPIAEWRRYGIDKPLPGRFDDQRRILEQFMYEYDISVGQDVEPAIEGYPMVISGSPLDNARPRFRRLTSRDQSGGQIRREVKSIFYLVLKPVYPHCYVFIHGVEISDLEAGVKTLSCNPGIGQSFQGARPTDKFVRLPIGSSNQYKPGIAKDLYEVGTVKGGLCFRVPIAILDAVAPAARLTSWMDVRVKATVKVTVSCVAGSAPTTIQSSIDRTFKLAVPLLELTGRGDLDDLKIVFQTFDGVN